MRVCVKEIYVKEVCLTGLCAAEMYLEELCAKERCVRLLCVTVPTPATEKQHRCHQVPRQSATPATQKSRGATQSKAPPEPTQCRQCHPAAQRDRRWHQVPRLPHTVTIDGTKCHACQLPRLSHKLNSSGSRDLCVCVTKLYVKECV